MAQHIPGFFAEPRKTAFLDRLLARVTIAAPERGAKGEEGPLAGLTFVFTGGLEGYTRHDAQALVEGPGGRASCSVGKQTDYVVVGSDPGGKLEDARRLGITTLDEAAFVTLLRDRGITR